MYKSILNARSNANELLPDGQENESLSLVTKVCLAVIFISAALVGILPKAIIGIIILCACVPLINYRDIYLVYPVIIFYHLQLGQLFGVSVYSLFSLMFFLFSFLKEKDLRINTRFVAPFVLFVVYCFVVIGQYNIKTSFLAIFDTMSVMILVTHYLSVPDKLKKFFRVFALIALVAFFTGTRLNTGTDTGILVNGEVVDLVRNCATFEDPNYMGFFYTVAIFSTVTLKLFDPRFRVVLIIVLYAMLLSTLSVTAIVVNVLIWLLYLVIAKKITFKVFLLVVFIVGVLLGLYSYGKANPDMPIFGMLATRMTVKFEGVAYVGSENIGSLTSGRTDLARVHFDYFMELPIWRMFVGMNAASSLRTDLSGFRTAAHNEYVDWLLNVGIIGTLLMIWFILSRFMNVYRDYKESHDLASLFVIFSKLIWMFYAFTLTVYGDFRFLLFFLL